jgi:hypothetical protein
MPGFSRAGGRIFAKALERAFQKGILSMASRVRRRPRLDAGPFRSAFCRVAPLFFEKRACKGGAVFGRTGRLPFEAHP